MENRTLLNAIWKRKGDQIGHTMRIEGILITLEGTGEMEKKSIKQSLKMVDDIKRVRDKHKKVTGMEQEQLEGTAMFMICQRTIE